MPFVRGHLELEQNAPFEEIPKKFYTWLFECVPPYNWSRPYIDGGWFICGEPHSNDEDLNDYHYLCFCHNGKYYAGCRRVNRSIREIEDEIRSFMTAQN